RDLKQSFLIKRLLIFLAG
ncbi:peptidase M20/M25/M40 family protein, partial [Chlamydia psittaci 06-1683]